MAKKLRHGFTTGACAAAAAKGAALLLAGQRWVERVEIALPAGFAASFELHGQQFSADSAACFVVKDAGDDPDVTDGVEVHAVVRVTPPSPPLTKGGCPRGGGVTIEGGPGIGKVTKPGLAVSVGEWAINPVPRRMISEAVLEVFALHPSPSVAEASAGRRLTPHVTISIPDGEERAQRTLNARLGILGGLSILGTTGIVRPISHQAWTDTLDAAINVALACGCQTLVLSTGRTSELVAQKTMQASAEAGAPPEEAFIMMGDHVGYALRACAGKGVKSVILAGQFAKLLKIACGHEQTHVSSSDLDLRTLADWLVLDPQTASLSPLALRANTARQVLIESGADSQLLRLICDRAKAFAEGLAAGVAVKVLLAGYSGEVLYFG
jgi:cobalt-precorrin-5B (C1)-methyltransferase